MPGLPSTAPSTLHRTVYPTPHRLPCTAPSTLHCTVYPAPPGLAAMHTNGQEAQGLAGSQHRTLAAEDPPPGLGAAPRKPRPRKPGTQANEGLENIRHLLNSLITVAEAGEKAAAVDLAEKIANQWLQGPGTQRAQETVTVTNLQKVVTEAVQAAVKTTVGGPLARTWADVASGAQSTAPGAIQGPPRKVTPQRANRETLIKGNNLPADLASRTPAEIT